MLMIKNNNVENYKFDTYITKWTRSDGKEKKSICKYALVILIIKRERESNDRQQF